PKARATSLRYVHGALPHLRPGFGDAEKAPSTLSVRLTSWKCNGWRSMSLAPRLFGPLNCLPAHETSVPLFGGPKALDARDEFLIPGSRFPSALPVIPNGLRPLNSWFARPSQNRSRMKTDPMTVGALRPVPRRLLPNGGSGFGTHASAATFGS